MRWTYILLATTVLGWTGCGGSEPATGPKQSAATPAVVAPSKSPAVSAGQKEDRREPAPAQQGSDDKEGSEEQEPDASGGDAPGGSSAGQSAAPEFKEPQTATDRPALTGEYAETTLVQQGDALPELTVSDLEGNEVRLSDLRRGAKAMVVVFWDPQAPTSELELEYLERNLSGAWKDNGVRVVGVLRGDNKETVRQAVQTYELSFPMLLDPNAAAFGQLATRIVPRTYVVDAEGSVQGLWIGFQGRSTIDEIQQRITAVLGN